MIIREITQFFVTLLDMIGQRNIIYPIFFYCFSTILYLGGDLAYSKAIFGDTISNESQEIIHFHIKYGWFTIGKGRLEIEPVFFRDSWHTRVFVTGKTSGLLSSFKPYSSVYESYINPKNLFTDSSYTHADAANGVVFQIDQFFVDQQNLEIKSIVNDSSFHVRRFPLKHTPIFDVLGTFLFLRQLPLRDMNRGDSVMLDVFYEKRLYPFGVEYIGKNEIDLQNKKQKVFELFLLFPVSKTFPEPRLVRMWISDDENQTPLLVRMKLKVGNVVLETVQDPKK